MKLNDLVILVDRPNFTFTLAHIESDWILLRHQLVPDIFIKTSLDKIRPFEVYNASSIERNLKYLSNNSSFLNYNDLCELESISIFYFIKNKISSSQLKRIAELQGKLSSIKFHGDINKAIDLVNENKGILDSFNQRWYEHYTRFFSKAQVPVMENQRKAIFNIAGFVLSELNITIDKD